jgi:sugar/nucleoside kinase (ribokinase family)
MAKRQVYKETKFDLVVFGEFFSDMIFYNLRRRPRFSEEAKTDSFLIAPGGGLSTTAIAASRLGTRTGVITRIGADADYLPTWNQLALEKLDIAACERRKDLPTALTVCVAYKSDRMMVTHEPINRRLEDMLEHKAVLAKLGQTRHVHLACALHRPGKWLPVLRSLRERGITISADFGWNPDISINQLISIIRHCDFVFPTEHEARAITSAKSPLTALEKLHEWVRVPVVKLGARGTLLMAEGKLYRQPALALPLVDATGVGDAFNGGFLHAFLHGSGWDDCLRAGNILSSMAGTQAGGSQGLPTSQEYKRQLEKIRQA